MLYIWRVKTRLPERKGTLCHVLKRGGMNSQLVEFMDGYKVITSRNYTRRAQLDTLARLVYTCRHKGDRHGLQRNIEKKSKNR